MFSFAIIPDFHQILALLASYFVFATFILSGALICRHRDDIPVALLPFVGAGAFYALLLLVSFLRLPWGIALTMVIITAGTWVYVGKCWQQYAPILRQWMPLLLLVFPVAFIVAGKDVKMWDDFAHWLPAAQYITELGHLPIADIPATHANTSYPYGLALQNAAISWLSGHFSGNANAIMNVLWLSSLLFWLPRAVAGGAVFWAGGLALFGSVLGAEYLASSYADPLLAVGVTHLLLWGLQHVRDVPTFTMRWLVFSLMAVVFVSIKQVGVVMLFFAGFALFSTHLCFSRPTSVKELFEKGLRWVAVFAPALVLDRVWSLYVMWNEIPGGFGIRAPSEWYWEFLPLTLASAWQYVQMTPSVFVYLPLLLVLSLFKKWRVQTLVILGFCVLYILFLLFTYIASFSPFEGKTAASFSRYAGHVALLGWVGVLIPVGSCLGGFIKKRFDALVVTILSVAVLAGAVYYERAEFWHQSGYTSKVWDALAEELVKSVPKGTSLTVIDAVGNGFVAKHIEYKMNRHATLPMLNMYHNDLSMNGLMAFVQEHDSPFVLLYSLRPEHFGAMNLEAGRWYLVEVMHHPENGTKAWHVRKNWQIP